MIETYAFDLTDVWPIGALTGDKLMAYIFLVKSGLIDFNSISFQAKAVVVRYRSLIDLQTAHDCMSEYCRLHKGEET